MSLNKMRKKKGAMIPDYVGWLLIGAAILVLALLIYAVITGKMQGLIENIKNLFRFRIRA